MPKRKESESGRPTLAQLRKQAQAAWDADQWDEVIRLYGGIVERMGAKAEGESFYRFAFAYNKKGEYDKAIECYQKALDTPGYDTPSKPWNNMGVAYHNKGEFDKAIECYQKALDTPGYDTPGKALYNMGLACRKKGDYGKAIECYQKALDTGYDTPGNAWNDMGIACDEKGEYDKAIECYQKALDTPGYDTPGDAWNNIGIAYGNKNEYDKEIECYQKALDTLGYDTPGSAWNNMGIAYRRKGEYDKAIECYQKALDTPGYDAPGKALYNMGLANRDKGTTRDLRKAQIAFLKAFEKYRETGQMDDAERAGGQARMAAAQAAVGKNAVEELYPALAAAEAMQEEDEDKDDPRYELEKIDSEATSAVEGYQKDYKAALDDKKENRPDSAIIFLKGWSSSEPFLFAGSEMETQICGGGLFLRWKGKGVVIDPGINYLSNLHSHGYFVQDIDALIVTHDHIDHTFDLDAIDDMILKVASCEKHDEKRYCFFSHLTEEKYHKWLDTGRYEFLPRFDHPNVHGVCDPRQFCPDMSFVPFRTKHDKKDQCFGVKCLLENVEGKKVNIGITSDTSFFPEIIQEIQDSDLIVVHISSPDSEEYRDREYLKKDAQHLGLNGTRKLIEGTKAQVYVITEFWGGFGDRRVPLCQKLKYDLRKFSEIEDKCIIPADLGLTILLELAKDGKPCFKIKCTTCNSSTKCQDIAVVRPDESFGRIRYLCPVCEKRLRL